MKSQYLIGDLFSEVRAWINARGIMVDRVKDFFELKVTLGNIITIIVLLASGYAGYVELKANHSNLDHEFRQHQVYDDARFKEYATIDARNMRDKWVDDKFKEIQETLKRIEDRQLAKR